MHSVEQILDCQPYRLLLKFSNGEIRWIDLEPTLKANANTPVSAYRQLLNAVVFREVRLDHEARTIYWEGLARMINPDGREEPAPLDFCPDALYEISVPAAQEEVEKSIKESWKVKDELAGRRSSSRGN